MPEKIKLPRLLKAFVLFFYWFIGAFVIWGVCSFFVVHKESNFQHLYARNVCFFLYLCLYLIFLGYATRSFLQKETASLFYLPAMWSLALIAALMCGLYKERPDLFHWKRSIHSPQSVAEEADQCGIAEQWIGPEYWFSAKPEQYVSKNFDEAFMWCQKAANAGDAGAQTAVGGFHERGIYMPKNYIEAQKWYKLAIVQGSLKAKYLLARMYSNDAGVEDFPAAASLFREIVQSPAGDLDEYYIAEAQANLGSLYLEGKGVPQDYMEAMKWLRSAADMNNEMAQFKIGEMYEKGLGVKQDYSEAANWYGKAQARYIRASYNLAVLYEKGLGVKQDDDEAFNYYLKAAQNRDVNARRWIRKKGEAGNIRAQYELGYMDEHDFEIGEEHGKPAKWYERAAEQGDVKSQKRLGFFYQLRNRYEDAYFWLSIAANSGDKDCARYRDSVKKKLSPDQIADMNKKISRWKPASENVKNP